MENLKNLLQNKKIVALLVLAIIILAGILIKTFLLTDKKIKENKDEKKSLPKEMAYEAEEGVTHYKDMSFTIIMSDKMKNKIDFEKLERELQEFCIENSISAPDLTATHDGGIIENFNTDLISFGLLMNNYANTYINVDYIDGEYLFYYK